MKYQVFIPRVAEAFGLDFVATNSPQKGYRNESYMLTLRSGVDINLIFHKNEREACERIKAAHHASSILNQAHLPVRVSFDKRILKLSDGKKDVYAGVYTYLPGKTIPWEAYTKHHIKLLGWAMSDMHVIWRQSPVKVSLRVDDELRETYRRMERYFGSQDVVQAINNKLQLSLMVDFSQYERLFERLGTIHRSSEHILHMDLVRGNALFSFSNDSPWSIDNTSLSGVIDFEKAAVGHPVYDIARTMAFLIVDCQSKGRHSIFKYFLQSGYNKRGGSSFSRNDVIAGMTAGQVLNILIGFFLLHDFYKFLRHTPYESLGANHHFVRTRDILIDYGMIRYYKD